MESIKYDDVLSPCKNICRFDTSGKYCIGCYRTYEEKKSWWKFTKEEKLKIIEDLKKGIKRFN